MVSSIQYRFGGFRLDPQARELRFGDDRIALPSSAFDCLVYLVEHRQRAVGRDELISAVWGRADVSEKLLGQTMVRVRRAVGDTGGAQHSVRTVARFGYRWVAATEGEDSRSQRTAAAEAARTAVSVRAGSGFPAKRRVASAMLAVAAVLSASALLSWSRPAADRMELPAAGESAPEPISGDPAAALVLPAIVRASAEWEWLRLGLMELVATNLRRAELPTASSESVVALLRQHGDAGADLLQESELAEADVLRVQPHVALDDGVWRVRLEIEGAGTRTHVQSEADDVLVAARRASDALLIGLGRPVADTGADGADDARAMDELVYRVSAAMFADRLDLARSLIQAAPEALRGAPRVTVLLARLDLQSGDYLAAERALRVFLDRPPPAGLDAVVQVKALLVLGAVYTRDDRPDDAEAAYSRAIELLEGRGQPSDLGFAYMGRGGVAVSRSQQERGIADLALARMQMAAAGDAYGAALVDLNLGLTDMTRHRPAEALAALQLAAERLERMGAREDLAYARIRAIDLHLRLLDYQAALAASDALWPPERHSGNHRLRWRVVLVRARALAAVGRVEEASGLLQRIRADSDPVQDALVRAEGDALAAELALQSGAYPDAAALARAAMTPAIRSYDAYVFGRVALTHVRALLAARRLDEAASAVRAMRAWAEEGQDPWRSIYARLAAAELAGANGRREAARRHFDESVRMARDANGPEDLLVAAIPYVHFLIDLDELEAAVAISGPVMPWAERDYRVAWMQARLYHAKRIVAAADRALESARRLAGDRDLGDLDVRARRPAFSSAWP